MSEIPPEGGGAPAAGGFMSRKFLGIPAIVWLLGAAVLAFLYFRHQSSATGAGASSTGGPGTSTTGDIAFTPGQETINVQGQYGPNNQSESGSAGGGTTTIGGDGGGDTEPPPSKAPGTNPQPAPRPKKPTMVNQYSGKVITVQRNQTLQEIASQYHGSVPVSHYLTLLAHANKYVTGEVPGNKKVGQPLGTGAGLKTGQRITLP